MGGVPRRGRSFKFDFPSATFWVKIFFGWLGLRAKRPPTPSYKQSLGWQWSRGGMRGTKNVSGGSDFGNRAGGRTDV